ncbi:hypothetical protein [Pelagibius sp.]|uniref:hypothetical protein n=1 Tax=Pelagibius sp. TaxID=1931238 RepID=UPI003BB21A13
MDAKLLVSTALVTSQASVPAQSAASPQAGNVLRRPAEAATVSASAKGAKTEAGEPLAAVIDGQQPAATGQGAPNSALTTYRDQDSGRLIVRVYDRENGDVLIEFPPERAFRPVDGPLKSPQAKARNSFSV